MSKDAPGEMRSLLVTRESRVPTIVALLVTVVMMTVTMVDFVGDLQATDEFTSTTPEWNLSFETQTYTMQAVETLQDDESRNVLFDLSDISIPEGYTIGSIDVVITSEEEEGVSVQCDSVAGDIIENDLTAQWADPASNLSGQARTAVACRSTSICGSTRTSMANPPPFQPSTNTRPCNPGPKRAGGLVCSPWISNLT